MAWLIDLKFMPGGFYFTFLQLFGIGLRYKPESLMFVCGVYKFNVYLTFAIE